MLRVLVILLALAAHPLLAHALGLSSQAPAPTIRAEYVSSYCDGNRPIAVINLHINGDDVGLPGILYVAMHDPAEQQASYAVAGSNDWYEYGGEAMYPPYAVVTAGLQDVSLRLAAGPVDWKLYVGYGALTPRAEAIVQAGQSVVAKARAMGRAVTGIDPNHHRRALVQEDMKRNAKFINVLTWGPANMSVCDANVN
jgi:hypothetical protein